MARITRTSKDGFFIKPTIRKHPDDDDFYFCRRGEFSPEADLDFEHKHLRRIEFWKKYFAEEDDVIALVISKEQLQYY